MTVQPAWVTERTRHSFHTIEASNGLIAFAVLPELGAKIVTLRDLRNRREWLWTSDRLPLAQHPYGSSYIETADTGGWDECFPTVATCEYPLEPQRGLALPDHGDLWAQRWDSKVERDADSIRIVNSCSAIALPCAFARSLALRAGAARLDMHYAVQNKGSHEVAFIWSAHPLLRIEPGMVLEFPASARFNVYSATARTNFPQREGLHWPVPVRRDGHDIRLDPLPGPDAGVAFKIWSERLSEGWARLVARDGALLMRFDVTEIPQVALWLNAGGWSGIGGEPYYNIALEPCIGAQDSLAEAVTHNREYAVLRPGETRRWSLTVDLDTGPTDQTSATAL
jgi:galactose mutarotase-like enzyme